MWWLLSAIVVVGVALRGYPLLLDRFTFESFPGAYDNSVYYSASALVVNGRLPYRDFIFLHPPGITIALAPIALLGELIGHRAGFVLARWATLAVSAANIWLVASLARRWKGWPAALLAAALFATFPLATATDGTRILEPCLILLCLAAASVLLRSSGRAPTSTQLLVTGVLLGLATSIKLWGGIFLLAALAAVPVWKHVKRSYPLLLGYVGALLIVVVPFAVVDVKEFVRLVLVTQSERSGQGFGGFEHRVPFMFRYGPLGLRGGDSIFVAVAVVVAIGFAMLWAWRKEGGTGRFWTTACGVTTVLLLVSPVFFVHYVEFLAASTSVLLAAATMTAYRRIAQLRRPILSFAMIALIVATPVIAFLRSVQQNGEVVVPRTDFGVAADRAIPKDECIFSDFPALTLDAGRLPGSRSSDWYFADPLGGVLAYSAEHGDPSKSSYRGFRELPRAQSVLRDQMTRCRFFATDYDVRNHPWWSRATTRWFFSNYRPLVARPGFREPKLWERGDGSRSGNRVRGMQA